MSITRRSFLAAAGAAAAPLLLPACATPKKPAANSMVNMGFIGMGIQNRGLMEAFMGHKNVRVLAVCDVDTTRRTAAQERVTARYKGEVTCAAYTDFRELIARRDIDAVCIATPDHWHAIPTIAALESGKDVYCEKPLTHTIHEAVAVMNAVRKTKRILQTGSMQRSMEEFRVACELVRNGMIGKIDHVTCCVGNPGKPCDLPEEPMEPGLDWNYWLGPAPQRPYSSVLSPRGVHKHFPDWRSYMEYGGGGVCDFGAHHFDIAQWGLNMDESGPVKVEPPKEGLSGAIWTYDNGITVKHASEGFNVEFYGSEGEVRVGRGQFEFWLKGKKIAGWAKREDGGSLGSTLKLVNEQYLADAKVKLYVSRDHPSNFLDCLASRREPITNAEVGGRSAIVCHLVNQAYYNRATLKWDPKKLCFAEGGGKPEWMTYNYRGPWKV